MKLHCKWFMGPCLYISLRKLTCNVFCGISADFQEKSILIGYEHSQLQYRSHARTHTRPIYAVMYIV